MSAITTGPGIKLQGEIVLWRSLASRSIFALWMLEELGLPFRSEVVGRPRPAALLKIEPSGRVPVLVAEGEVVSEAPAICLFLADRYGEGRFGPGPGEKGRGALLKWIVWSTAVLEPARELAETQIAPRRNGWGPGWPTLDLALEDLVRALMGRAFLLGETFTAADVMVGGIVSIGLFCELLPPNEALLAYDGRLQARPALQRASALNWPAATAPSSA